MSKPWSWFLVTTGIAACPCHFPITLPIVVGALGGTSLGGFIAASTGLVYGVGAAYFMIGIGLSLYLLNRRSARAGAMHLPLGTKRAGPGADAMCAGSSDENEVARGGVHGD